jgi:hypothetical protein
VAKKSVQKRRTSVFLVSFSGLLMLFCLSRAENTSLNRYQKKGSVQKKEEEEEGEGDQGWGGY